MYYDPIAFLSIAIIRITENNPIKIQEAKETLVEYNQIYHLSLAVKEEAPIWLTPNIVKYVYIGHIYSDV